MKTPNWNEFINMAFLIKNFFKNPGKIIAKNIFLGTLKVRYSDGPNLR